MMVLCLKNSTNCQRGLFNDHDFFPSDIQIHRGRTYDFNGLEQTYIPDIDFSLNLVPYKYYLIADIWDGR